ncbi:receptor-activated Ca2+-permeable cation channel [Coniochaeta sp. 2T2.1]|nr:receptor-activated Ca2+-permeable cation channel [Coniochaeta sp. 2T2.1]
MADGTRRRPPASRRPSRRQVRSSSAGLDSERAPLLPRSAFNHHHHPDLEPVFGCTSNNPVSHLPVYTNIHRIRRDIVFIVEDYLSLDQLRDVRINVSVVRPLVDKLYDLDDISIVYCLLVNRAQFLNEQSHLNNRQNVHFTRATLCELIATRILRRFSEDNEGTDGLLVLSHILVAGFEPFQNAPEDIRKEARATGAWNKTLPALEVAILTESKLFLSSTSCQKVVDAIYEGRVIYTPSSFLDIIPDHYKQKPISLYDPRSAPLLNQYRLIVPRTRNFLELLQFCILLVLYVAFMTERDASRLSKLEICFAVYAFGWSLDTVATVLEHGWSVYTQNLWSFLDATFTVVYLAYLGLRIHGLRVGDVRTGQQALDVLAMGAPVLIPRLAFNVLSGNLLFVSLRAMMADFTVLSALAIWCFLGFLLSLMWLGEGRHEAVTISKWMIYIWFGLDGTGIQRSTEFHWLLGPSLMITFSFLGNTLFLTILVSMLSNTFSTIVSNATAEVQFRHAVFTLEGVKSDAIFAYQPPFNILALLVLVPLKWIASPRWFHKIHVFSVRLLSLPLLLVIAVVERRGLWPNAGNLSTKAAEPPARNRRKKSAPWFWEKWRITAHSDIETVFEIPAPEGVLAEVAADDDFTVHTIRRQFTRQTTMEAANLGRDGGGGVGSRVLHPAAAQADGPPAGRPASVKRQESGSKTAHAPGKTPTRRDSIAFPGLAQQIRGMLSEHTDETVADRLEALEEGMGRIESMLARLVGEKEEQEEMEIEAEHETVEDREDEGRVGKTGSIKDLDESVHE